jgi:hypothetical protein
MPNRKSKRNKQRGRQTSEAKPNQESGAEHMPNNIHVRGEINIARSPDLAKEHATERQEDSAQANKKYLIEILTLSAIVIYTGLRWHWSF